MAEHCDKHGISYYLPLKKETKVYQRRKVTVTKPIFSGYFFVSLNMDERVILLRTNHIIRILEPGNQRILLHQLAQIRRALRVDPCLSASDNIKKGSKVTITGGPFMGIEGLVSSVRNKTKVRLVIDMIGQSIAIDINKEYIKKADS